MVTFATEQKRRDLTAFIAQALEPYAAVQAVVGIGSIATGLARPDSDIDAIVFLDPFDPYIIPAEFKWRPSDGTFYSIFREVDGETLDFDFARFDLAQWSDPAFDWPEPRSAELQGGWLAFDRVGRVAQLIARRTVYSEDIRIARLDEAITWLDHHLSGDGPHVRWQTLGPVIAHDRLNAAFYYLVQGLFASNRRWQPWRNREMSTVLSMPVLPQNFAERVLNALSAPSLDYAGYMTRVQTLRSLFADLLAHLLADGVYGSDPISEAFIRSHDEPGRSWNMDAWSAEHRKRWNSL